MTITRKATMMDALRAGETVTEEDLKELRCSEPGADPTVHLTTFKSLAGQFPKRYRMRVLRDASGPLLIGGWDKLTGVAWFVTTTRAKHSPLMVMKAVKECKWMALQECPYLCNAVMKTNRMHVKLLDAIGAQWIGPITNQGNEPFQAFVIHQEVPCAG